jgi:hypothetical protein
MRASVITVLMVAAIAAAPAGAQQPNPVDPDITDGTAQRQLDAARAKWKAKAPGSYQMRVQRSCFCPTQYTKARTVVVRGGKIARAAEEVRDFATVPRLFKIVQNAIKAKVSVLLVDYDAKRGFPRKVRVDTSLQIIDEEQDYRASLFKAL